MEVPCNFTHGKCTWCGARERPCPYSVPEVVYKNVHVGLFKSETNAQDFLIMLNEAIAEMGDLTSVDLEFILTDNFYDGEEISIFLKHTHIESPDEVAQRLHETALYAAEHNERRRKEKESKELEDLARLKAKYES